jgi:saccharopine dehydrogenase (NADP+, L-glutamate forming)
MVIMQHEIEFEKESEKFKTAGTLKLIGEDGIHTAMAKTVGLPLGIAAKLILDETIQLKGLHIPVAREIYEPVLAELAQNGIEFKEQNEQI